MQVTGAGAIVAPAHDRTRPQPLERSESAGLSEPELLLYRSNLLGSDLRITNFGGGNTSAKVTARDPLTRPPKRSRRFC